MINSGKAFEVIAIKIKFNPYNIIIFAANGNNELTKFVTAVGTLSGKVKTIL